MKSAPSPIPYVLTIVALLAGGGWWFSRNPTLSDVTDSNAVSKKATPSASSTNLASNAAFPPPQTVAVNTNIRIDGSTSMVTINQKLKAGFEAKFSGTQVETKSGGSDKGLSSLQAGQIDLAAVSRPLNAQETSQGLKALSIATDPVAIVVGINNPFTGSLTPEQAIGIFNGSINNWSQVGGANSQIRIINRPDVSGTRQVFQDLVLKGARFGTGPNFITLKEDATTPLLRALETDGIGYATYSQVIEQKTVRVLSINAISPLQPNYPYGRSLLYVYRDPPSPAVKAFLGYGLSSEGQKALRSD